MTPFVADTDFTLWLGDVRDVLPTFETGSVDCVVTSPPYWGLRDYGVAGQLGLEHSPEKYVENIVAAFWQVRRVLSDHGTLWLNLGDSYATNGSTKWGGNRNETREAGMHGSFKVTPSSLRERARPRIPNSRPAELKPKDLIGIPWRVAFALQADGWWLRSDVIWAKPNPMPESVTDRPTNAHEYVFLLSKSPRYWFDQEAVREQASWDRWSSKQTTPKHSEHGNSRYASFGREWTDEELERYRAAGRNVRDVWEIATQPYAEAHFATFPEELVRRCILAGCPELVCRVCGKPRERLVDVEYENPGNRLNNGQRAGGTLCNSGVRVMSSGRRLEKSTSTIGWSDCGHGDYRPGRVLDPFLGSGTTALVARQQGRHCVGVELSEPYGQLAARRLQQLSLLAEASP